MLALADGAVGVLESARDTAIAQSTQSGKASGLLKLLIMQSVLFLEAAKLCVKGHADGLNRAAFALQRCLFEYHSRAVAYQRGVVDPEATWSAMVHRVYEDARQAGAGVPEPGVTRDYEGWKDRTSIPRPTEIKFEKLLKSIYAPGDAESEKYIFQRYRRPGLFAHGTLGVVDDIFEAGEHYDRLTESSPTIDPDAQLIAIACLACDFASLFNETFSLGMKEAFVELQEDISKATTAHNARRPKPDTKRSGPQK